MKHKIIVINKCQDCKYSNCKLKQLAGLIPEQCPLIELNPVNDYVFKHMVDIIEQKNKEILGL